MEKFKITGKEWAFIGVMFVLALIFTNQYWVRFLAGFNPLVGFLIYYAIVYISLILMSYLGLVVFGVKIKKPLQILGSGLVLFAFFLIFNWSSNYINLIHAENALINNSEDGMVFWLWSSLILPNTPFKLWVVWALAFPISVAVISFLAVLLIHKKPEISPR